MDAQFDVKGSLQQIYFMHDRLQSVILLEICVNINVGENDEKRKKT